MILHYKSAMLFLMLNSLQPSDFKKWTVCFIKLAIVMMIISIYGFQSIKDYGVSWDEPYGIVSTKRNLDILTKNIPINDISKYDGTVFNFLAESVYQIHEGISNLLSNRPFLSSNNFSLKTPHSFLKRYQLKHILTFFTSLIVYLSVAVMVGILCGFDYCWVGALIFSFFPRFWGY